jgi:hypothetical protein
VRSYWPFSHVWLAWGKWWAIQAYFFPCVSFGVHLDPTKPLMDVHFLIFTFSLGPDAHITGQRDRHRQSCRGFLFADHPIL